MAALTPDAPLLTARALTRHFGGLRAVDGVDFDLAPGEIHALIGPNGAGKTTFVSLLCGRIPAQSGTIRLAGQDITRLPAHARVARGIAYTFQITSIYPRLTVFDNLALAVQRARPADLHRATLAALARVGLQGRADQDAGTLSYGHQRLLEIAMGLALAPRVLILDEPTQGLAASEIEAFKALIRGLIPATTVLLIEHNMDVVMDLAHRITVLNFGQVLATGTPAEIRASPAVQAAYLGVAMLRLKGVASGYGAVRVLSGVTLTALPGQVTCVMGRNGAGKTTMLRTIMGQTPASAGTIHLGDTPVHNLPAHEVPRHGIGYVPQGRRLFPALTVAENIEIGLMTRRRGDATRAHVLALFPRLNERLDQPARTLSGGEQQMLAIARALCLEPSVLLLDEPTEGLQPSMIALIRDTLQSLKATGVATILVEQRVEAALTLADSVAFMAHGTIAETHPAAMLTRAHPAFAAHVEI